MDFLDDTQDSEASSMLEEALKQMDGILISGTSPSNLLTNSNLNSEISSTNVISTAKSLALALQQIGLSLAPSPETEWSKIIFDWLGKLNLDYPHLILINT